MSYGMINANDFKNSKFDKTCIKVMLLLTTLVVYLYYYFVINS